ncbi:MAG: HAD hydrolase-like protein [Kofleriaceae bacterium]
MAARPTRRSSTRSWRCRRGHPATVDEQQRFLACYLGHLEIELAASTGFRVLDGVVAALDYLAGAPRAALGIGTGNVAAGAQAKLRRAGLHERFRFGGYGDDSAIRAELVAAAIARGRALYPDAERAVVVGDTIHDITAARACGATASPSPPAPTIARP